MTTRVTEGARRGRPRFSRLAASPLNARACALPLPKSEEKERLLAVYPWATHDWVIDQIEGEIYFMVF